MSLWSCSCVKLLIGSRWEWNSGIMVRLKPSLLSGRKINLHVIKVTLVVIIYQLWILESHHLETKTDYQPQQTYHPYQQNNFIIVCYFQLTKKLVSAIFKDWFQPFFKMWTAVWNITQSAKISMWSLIVQCQSSYMPVWIYSLKLSTINQNYCQVLVSF